MNDAPLPPNAAPTEYVDPPTLDVCRSIGQARAIAATIMLGSMGVYALLWDAPMGMRLFAIAIAAAVLLSRSAVPMVMALVWVWGGALVLGQSPWIANDRLGLGDLVSTMALLVFVLFALRCVEFQRMASAPSQRQGGGVSLAALFRRRNTAGEASAEPSAEADAGPNGQGSSSPAVSLQPMLGASWRSLAAPALALFLLWLAPLRAMTPNAPGIAPSAYRVLVFAWMGAFVAIGLSVIFAAFQWRCLTPRQAALYVRATLIRQTRRELTAVERAQARRASRFPRPFPQEEPR